jgi:predicted DNA-binding antitoxin AbrB/MazE fold protein
MADMITVPAVYEQGVLRPLVSLSLLEHQRVRVVVEPVEEALSEEDEEDAELSALVGIDPPLALEEEREELHRVFARKFAAA